ncbi:aspartate-alanine antiporter (plasmid) [Enterobacter asburiae]|uniref:aspartate-alanine antiporter n=1 Tax=Enterobacter asburiae TaxID=61645 RepID=UPI0029334A84|nr:aspartate-alanine antiporter [Enterobacter asburiae]EMA4739791.1 aspartate-alanine antiporter [Enterobacter asburiae]
MEWFVHTLRTYPEIAIFLSLGIGYWVGDKSFKGLSLGAVTATLIAALVVGSVGGIDISANVKSIFFLLFLFAVGYGVGPQFVQGIAKDGLPQALFSVVVCILCLVFPIVAAKLAGYDLGYAVGLFAGSQTISASMGLATDAITRLGLGKAHTHQLLNAMPIAYAVTYIFGTVGSAVILAKIGPKLLGINLEKACKDYEEEMGGDNKKNIDSDGTAWHRYVLRAYVILPDSPIIGMKVSDLEQRHRQHKHRLFIERIRRNNNIIDVLPDTIIQSGDILAIMGKKADILGVINNQGAEIEDPELLAVPVEGVDVYVTKKEYTNKTLEQLACMPMARGVFIRQIKRGSLAHNIPILPKTSIRHGDILTLSGLSKDIAVASKALGHVDRATTVADVSFISLAIFIGTIIGAVVFTVQGIPLTLSTAGGALIAGLIFGWLRSIHPTCGRIPQSTLWFMNSVGLNMFIAVVGINAAPGFIAGLQTLGISLFLWGIFATTLPLIISLFIGRYLFRFHPAILFGCCAGARTTTAALGMICETAKSNVPALGYTVTYAVGNTLLTIWGMVIVMILA